MTALIHQPHPAIDKKSIQKLVATFYERARQDELIGAIFAREVKDWDHHIVQITEFWSAIILKTGKYDGRPLPPHLKLNLKNEHFDRWLSLFEQTSLEIFPEDAAAIFIDRAKRVADSFEMAIAAHSGKISTPRHTHRIR